MKKKLLILLTIFFLLLILAIVIATFIYLRSNKATIIFLPPNVRGDMIDPGPVDVECRKNMNDWRKGKGYVFCQLKNSKVGYSDTECPNGFSPQGCTICVIECR